MELQKGGSIQKIIHQIWIGKNPLPTLWMDTVKDFAEAHGYTYKLWKDTDISSLPMNSIPGLAAVYKSFGDQLAGRADIIRMLVLYKEGGIYIDEDTVILKPDQFNTFLEKNRAAVFFGWEEIPGARIKKLDLDPDIKRSRKMVANGIIGAEKGHPFFKELLEGVVDNIKEESSDGEKPQAWKAVGPHYVTRKYRETRKKHPDVHVYPMKYFYPRHWAGIKDPRLHERVRVPKESMMFQYGYTTNSFAKYFKKLAARRTRRRRH
jgi:mannosyltransferase OCH1-like enzyme